MGVMIFFLKLGPSRRHNEKAQQEACAFALGTLKDETSIRKLENLARSTTPHVRLAL